MRIIRILIFPFLLFFGYGCTKSSVSVQGLRCEYLTNPLGIDVETPRFSWIISDPAHTRGQQQTGYRILVATTPEKLKNGKADVWDSGAVSSPQSHLVLYEGIPLLSGGDYYWKVMVYDINRQASDWSAVARFSMGLLSRNDWKGKWIKHPAASAEKHIWFRKKLSIDDKASTAFACVASMGYHELCVNGQKAGNRVLAPAISRIDKRILYVTYDIASLLKKGDNIVSLWYAPGWSRNDFFAPLVNQSILLQLDGKTKQGDAFTLHTDETWKCAESYSRNTGLYQFTDMGGEEVNGKHYCSDWNSEKYDDSEWVAAIPTAPLKDGGEPTLSAQMTDASRIIETISAQQLIDTIPGVWSVDMGQSFTGFLQVRFNGLQAGDTVRIQISDHPEILEEYNQRHYYIARGEDGETFLNRFNVFGGRYMNFTGLKQALDLSDVTGYPVSSAGERTGYFECSNELFNRIYATDCRTYEMCNIEGVTVDCPTRERLGYGAEIAYLTAWGVGLPCFASGAYYLKNVRDWSDVQQPDGSINYVAPQISRMWGGSMSGAAVMNIAWEHYQAYGDKKILEKAYGTGKRWLDFMHTYATGGLLTPYDQGGYFLGEWVSPGPTFEMGDTPEALFFNNCAYAMGLDFCIHIAEALGVEDETAPYRERLAILRTKMHEKYFDPAINSYLNGDQVRTAFALYTGIVPDSLQQAVLTHLENDLTGEHPYFNIGSYTRYPYFHVLFAHPQFHEIIAGILSKTTYPGYGYFLSKGHATWPEIWEIKHLNRLEHSCIHTSYTGISAWFIKSLAGIEPDTEEPGYRTISIHPNPVQQLTYAKAGLESPYGLIESSWEKKDGLIIYDISIPVGCKARISLPGGDDIQVESGKYRFESENTLNR